MSDYSDLLKTLFVKIKVDAAELLKNGLNASNILVLTDLIMKEVGKINMPGFEKKALVIATVKKFVDESKEQIADQATSIIDEINELGKLVDDKLDSFIDQIYLMHPELYKTQKKLCVFKEKIKQVGMKIKNILTCQ